MHNTRLKELRLARGLTLEALAEAIGTSKQTIHRYESGVISNIPPRKVEALASALGVTPQALMGWESERIPIAGARRVPMLGEIACGEPIFASEEHGGYIIADGNISADFCLKAHGNSMIGARIFDGDIVFIRSADMVENGEIAAVIIGDEATLKRVYYYPAEAKLVLSPENPEYAPLVYIGEELNRVHILGRAVAFQSRLV